MKYVRLALIPLCLVIIGIVRLIRPLVHIRFGEICSFRVGHLAGNTETYLCERDHFKPKTIDIFTHRGRISNKQLAKMFNRVMNIDPTHLICLLKTVDMRFRGWEKYCAESSQFDRDIHNLYEKMPCHISFTEKEKAQGELGLAKMGLPANAKFVCLIVRDGAYLKQYDPLANYHEFRDSEISTYEQAALALAERGYYVIRMGERVKHQFHVKHANVIDYATNGMRSDFMDVYLGAHCEFCVSTGTGFDAIPTIFRKPICYVNFAPIEYLMTFVNPSIGIWKHHVKDGKRMTPHEIIKSYAGQALASQVYDVLGITLEDNSPQEITDAVLEMADIVEGKIKYTPTDEALQESFWDTYPRAMSPYNCKPLHGAIRMRIGSKFLKQYQPRLSLAA